MTLLSPHPSTHQNNAIRSPLKQKLYAAAPPESKFPVNFEGTLDVLAVVRLPGLDALLP